MTRNYRKLHPRPQFCKMIRVPAGAATAASLRGGRPVAARAVRMAANREGYFRFRDTKTIVTDAHRRTKRAMARTSRRANRV